jgi:hypothetical protein
VELLKRFIQPLLVLALVLHVVPYAVSQEGEDEEVVSLYSLGDQTFAIHAGIVTTLFFFDLNGNVTAGDEKNLKIGGAGSLEWNSFLNNELSLGVEVGGYFSSTLLGRGLVIVPIAGKLTYFFRVYPFEFPIHIALGGAFTKLEDDLYFGPIVKPGASGYWNLNSQWAFGLKAEYWLVPELYFGDSPPQSQSTFANFLETTLSIFYHF